MTAAVERRRRAAATLRSTRSKVEAHDVADAAALRAADGVAFSKKRWAALSRGLEAEEARKTALETVRRYVRWLYWSDFLTPALEVVIAALLEGNLLDAAEVWVMARALEDGLDTLLTRSRAEAELGELATDVARLAALADAVDAAKAPSTNTLDRVCRSGAGVSVEDLRFSRSVTRVSANSFNVAPGEALAVSGPNGCGKSSLFALLQACARGDAAAPGGLLVDAGGIVSAPATIAHVAQKPYCPRHAIPADWLATRAAGADATAAASALDALDFYPGAAANATALAEEHDDFCGALSGGQRVKFELVRQLLLPTTLGARCPDLLLLDEIFSPLDPESKARVRSAIRNACPDAAILAIYHADAGTECVPSFDFFTGVLQFEKSSDADGNETMVVSRAETCV